MARVRGGRGEAAVLAELALIHLAKISLEERPSTPPSAKLPADLKRGRVGELNHHLLSTLHEHFPRR